MNGDSNGGCLRVLHCPNVVGGQAPMLARSERRWGVQSRCVSFARNSFGYEGAEFPLEGVNSRPVREYRRWKLFYQALRNFDVIHFNFGSTLMPCRSYDQPALRGLRALRRIPDALYERLFCLKDLVWLRKAGKAIFVTFQGDDARQGDFCRATYEIHHAHHVGTDYYPPGSDEEKRRRIRLFGRYAHRIYALNPDLMRVLPANARFLPYASVDLKEWAYVQKETAKGRPLRVVHAPTSRAAKGSDYVIAAVQSLRAQGHSIELVLVEHMPRSRARLEYEQADVVVDQLLAGWYGGLAVEVMALGKPVVCYIREDDLQFIPPEMKRDLPIINATPETLRDVLHGLLRNGKEALQQLGIACRRYVERWHDPDAIARDVIADYRAALHVEN